ncbi:MAG: nucleotidyltransferase [Candidatus Eremiobacteraeota bacterium]|nr:nucleotidyltransferase [Candidatus Eremiobacteraeota bacterium]MBC5801748.1 nucleotidyltransferase [Candidatus Eremiobacteraeota bacterium]MBC5824933.1 nucleotidyltransferase [Candidatus Eremiobacteraeota bacterium]
MESLRSSGDFRELLSLFNDEGVRYLIIGGFALAHYGRPRYTKDLDVWVDPAGENPGRVFRALARFGASLGGINEADFCDPDCVFQIGTEPIRVDVLNDISGVVFGDAWEARQRSFYADVPVFVISRDDYIANKRASGRPSDLRDVAALLEDEA